MNLIYRVNSINDCIKLSHTQCIIGLLIPCPDKKIFKHIYFKSWHMHCSPKDVVHMQTIWSLIHPITTFGSFTKTSFCLALTKIKGHCQCVFICQSTLKLMQDMGQQFLIHRPTIVRYGQWYTIK